MHRVLRGCIQLKSAPDANMMVDMTPVDYVSRAIIHLSKQKNLWEKPFMCSIPISTGVSLSPGSDRLATYKADF